MTKDGFIQLLRESVITQALITVMALGVTFVLVATGRDVPQEVWTMDGLVIGFYFGGKVQARVSAERALSDGRTTAAPATKD